MLVSNEKGRTETKSSVNNTLEEMMGPQCDSVEDTKLQLLLGLNSSNSNSLDIRGYSSEANVEDTSTADYNSNVKDAEKKRHDFSGKNIGIEGK